MSELEKTLNKMRGVTTPNRKAAKLLAARIKSFDETVANQNLDTNGYTRPGSQNRRKG